MLLTVTTQQKGTGERRAGSTLTLEKTVKPVKMVTVVVIELVMRLTNPR